jgi:F-type H+-transporting ATPase subunit delta
VSISIVGKRYAKALLNLAIEADAVERVGKDLSDFAAAWEESRDLRAAFENPSVARAQRQSILRALAEQASMHDHVLHTLLLLADRQRLGHVTEVAEAYAALSEARSGKVRAEITTAAEVDDAYLRELEQALSRTTGKQVVLVHNTDPSLIGGVVARIGDQVIDGSVKHRLTELKDELLR